MVLVVLGVLVVLDPRTRLPSTPVPEVAATSFDRPTMTAATAAMAATRPRRREGFSELRVGALVVVAWSIDDSLMVSLRHERGADPNPGVHGGQCVHTHRRLSPITSHQSPRATS